jgi:hypothetical protein
MTMATITVTYFTGGGFGIGRSYRRDFRTFAAAYRFANKMRAKDYHAEISEQAA